MAGCFGYHSWESLEQPRPMMPYEKFDAWKTAHQLALEVYRVTESWPKTERYELTGQARRAAPAPTNIAERAAKRGCREFRRYVDIALGSLSELSYLLRFSKDRGILDEETFQALDELRNRAGILTWRLYVCLGRHRTG
ncbi:MAG: four helix bundle protein [Gemmatimonadales bacterium]